MPNVGGLKNIKPDVHWLDAQLEAGLLFAVEEEDRPPDCLYEFNYQWDLTAAEVDLDFFEPYFRSAERRCNGTAYIRDEAGMAVADIEWNRLTRPCLALPARGTTVCHSHGAQIPQVIAAAKRRLEQASDLVAMRLVGMTAVRDEEGMRIRAQDRIAAMASVLDRAGIKAGQEIEVKASGFQNVLADLFGQDQEDGNAKD